MVDEPKIKKRTLYDDLDIRPYIHVESIDIARKIGLSSRIKIKWNCGKGHDVDNVTASNATRVIKKQRRFPCRYCTGRSPYNGVGSLLDKFPALAADWD